MAMLSDTGPEGDHMSGLLSADDWGRSGASVGREPRSGWRDGGRWRGKGSPLARKIITFNLLAILMLVVGVMFLNPFRDSLVFQRELGLVAETELVADVFEARRATTRSEAEATISDLDLSGTSQIFVFGTEGVLLASSRGVPRAARPDAVGLDRERPTTVITDWVGRVWDRAASVLQKGQTIDVAAETEAMARRLAGRSLTGRSHVETTLLRDGTTIFAVSTPIENGDEIVGAVAMISGAGEIDDLVRAERERVLQMFVIAIFVSVGLSLVLASTIANPLADLAAAAEIGRDRNSRMVRPSRIRIPDLSARPDEIGRLSSALRGMVAALYDRIDANEQFAADVSHEIKNPLASLRSAVGSLRFVTKPEQRDKLLDVIDHDVRRIDRLVSDISNASRLDSDLVREEEEAFDLLKMMANLAQYLGEDARGRGIEFIANLPEDPITIVGLESRLAQVFANLIGNAISFCGPGDAIRIWARKRDNRVLVVVEDTGPGIPEAALSKIFNRFYSERPERQFGNNSGLGLAISKQIVEAHGGVIWAENIRAADAGPDSATLGARFVVGLPV